MVFIRLRSNTNAPSLVSSQRRETVFWFESMLLG